MVTMAGATNVPPSIGLVMVTLGGELVTVTATGEEVVVTPRLSEATAVRLCEPTARLTGRSYGLEDTLPREAVPSKNWTLVTLPSLSTALAWIVTVAEASNEAPSMGFLMATQGGLLPSGGVERM